MLHTYYIKGHYKKRLAIRRQVTLRAMILKDIIKNDKPYEGEIFILGGDFKETFPVTFHRS